MAKGLPTMKSIYMVKCASSGSENVQEQQPLGKNAIVLEFLL